ncbi:hypothetical protein JXA88_16975 [Candidatus Fermentibacteria bacterium]|nr:hypothetical protein [Candidatus Fermentibacteria bacterium]
MGVRTPNGIVYFDDAVLYESNCEGCEGEVYWAGYLGDYPDGSCDLLGPEIYEAESWDTVCLVARGDNEYCDGQTVNFALSDSSTLPEGFVWNPLSETSDEMEQLDDNLWVAHVPWIFAYCLGSCNPQTMVLQCPPSFGVDCCDPIHECIEFCNVCDDPHGDYYSLCLDYCDETAKKS